MATFIDFPKVCCCPGWVSLKGLMLGFGACPQHICQATLLEWVGPKGLQLDPLLPVYLGVGLLHPWARSEQ